MVSIVGLPAVQYPRNALLDFSPVTSAIDNYQQQEALNRRMEMEGERLGIERENQGFRRERQPFELAHLRTQNDAASENLRHARLVNPLDYERTRIGVDDLRESSATNRLVRGLTRDIIGDFTGASPPQMPSAAPSAIPGVAVTPPVQPTRAAAAPASTPAAPSAPTPQAQPDHNALGSRFIQDHILSVPPEVGEARFGFLRRHPFFGPALREHGLHEMNWRDAASTMAGISVTPTTQSASAATAPTAPDAPASPRSAANLPLRDRIRALPEEHRLAAIAALAKQDMEGLTKILSGAESGGMNPRQRAETEEGLRREFASTAKDYFQIRDAYGRVEAVAANPSPAGDLALIFSYMKILDPGSTVREGEYATAENATNVPNRVRNVYNRITEGTTLSPEQRADFTGQARNIFTAMDRQYQPIQRQYEAIAQRLGVNPRNVVVDHSTPGPASATTDRPAPFTNPLLGQQAAPAAPQPAPSNPFLNFGATQQGQQGQQVPQASPQQIPPAAAAPVPGANRAPDGNWYVPDPQRPGKFLRVDQ